MKETRKQKMQRQQDFAAGRAADRAFDPIREAMDAGELTITPVTDRSGWERECADSDRIMAALGIEGDIRTEGGWLRVDKALAAIAALSASRTAQGPRSQKCCKGTMAGSHEPQCPLFGARILACFCVVDINDVIVARCDRHEAQRRAVASVPSPPATWTSEQLAERVRLGLPVVLSQPAQEERKTIRAHVPGCRKSFSVPVDLCSCGGRDFIPDPDFIPALPPSPPVADSPMAQLRGSLPAEESDAEFDRAIAEIREPVADSPTDPDWSMEAAFREGYAARGYCHPSMATANAAWNDSITKHRTPAPSASAGANVQKNTTEI